MKSILIASKNQSVVDNIVHSLGNAYKADVAADSKTCLDIFRRRRHEYTFIEISFLRSETSQDSRPNYREALAQFWKISPNAHIIILSSREDIREAVAAVKAGASNYLTYPFDSVELQYVTESLSEYQKVESELLHLRENYLRPVGSEETRSNSPLMREVYEKISSVASTTVTVLLSGETGTGKGVMARLLHSHSNRADKPFIALHCGAIPDTLIESELFGHEKGSFTGAMKRKLGKFQIADNGTLFLDEISTISLNAQIKLLQVLQDKSFARIGGDSTIEVDVRVIAATNDDLKLLCVNGAFRKDLYYRLNVFPIEVPPLRKRPEDIPLLIDTFLEKLNRLYNKAIRGIDQEVLEVLKRYSWPGNIRELENSIERAYVIEKSRILSASSFPTEYFALDAFSLKNESDSLPTLAEIKQRATDQAQRWYLREILAISKGRIDKAASIAGLTTRQTYNLLVRYGLHKEEFK